MFYSVFPHSFVLMVYIFYSISFSVHNTVLIYIMRIFYSKYSYSQLYCSFNVLFIIRLLFIFEAYYYDQFIFFSILISMLKYKIS